MENDNFFLKYTKKSGRKELFYFYSLYIICRSVVLYIELCVAENLCTWNFVTLYIWGEVFSSSAEFKTHRHIAGTESGGKAGRVVYCVYTGIRIRTIESLVEKDDAVVAVEHQIAGMNCTGLVCGCGKR